MKGILLSSILVLLLVVAQGCASPAPATPQYTPPEPDTPEMTEFKTGFADFMQKTADSTPEIDTFKCGGNCLESANIQLNKMLSKITLASFADTAQREKERLGLAEQYPTFKIHVDLYGETLLTCTATASDSKCDFN